MSKKFIFILFVVLIFFANNSFYVLALSTESFATENKNIYNFKVAKDGQIIDGEGNVVGNIYIGDVLNEDGSFTAVNGNTRYPDGRLKDKNGKIYNPDGSTTLPDGNTYYPDGKVVFADGTTKDATGVLHHADGSITTADGTKYYLDGKVVYPDGSEGTKSNAVKDTSANNTNGSLVYDAKTNSFKFK